MKTPCGCCAGLEVVTPQSEANRPGLSALAYRAGTHATFLESMLARISSIYLDVPAADGSGKLQRIFPLNGLVLNDKTFQRVSPGLSTRELDDPSIALLDAWATVADVLTFYEERIANEGYLRTATERRSILELARLVGYRLRPGISASVYLAFTVSSGFNGIIPAGTRAQSIPGAGEKPQPFETYSDLAARDVWNNLKPRLTRPQVITLPGKNSDGSPLAIPLGTGADIVETIYFQGISTNLNAGDHLLIVLGDGDQQQFLRKIHSVDVQPGDQRTEVTLDVPPPQVPSSTPGAALKTLKNAVQTFINEAAELFPDTDLASEIAQDILQPLSDKIDPTAAGATDAVDMVRAILPGLTEKHDLALKRKFTRLEPWIANILDTLNILIGDLTASSRTVGATGQPFKADVVSSPLERLTGIVEQLAKPPSLQPASSARLARTVSEIFSRQSDIAPRLLATFFPAAADKLYTAWGGVETPAIQLEVDALRVKAGLFPGTYPGPPTITQAPDSSDSGSLVTTTSYNDPPSINTAWSDLPHGLNTGVPTIALEAVYDKVLVGSWVAVDRPVLDAHLKVTDHRMTFHKVIRVQTLSRATSAYVTRITQLTLDPPWLADLTGTTGQPQLRNDLTSPDFLRGTVVYAQSEKLDLTEEPLDTDVEKRTIELDGLYDGLESGRWIIVSGERTDIPNVSGVTASELVMISSVAQGSRAPLCAVFPGALVPPTGMIPFASVSYTTDANSAGDKLVVGILAVDLPTLQGMFPKPPSPPNQQFCDQVQLGPGVYASAYVPTPAELEGDFSDFEGLLINPATSQPYPGGQIPIDPTISRPQVFAWRISTEPVHTILNLANDLAYRYDPTNVTIYGNVAKATHGQTQGEVLGEGNASAALQHFPLHQSPLTYLPAPTPSGAESTLVVRVNEIEWHESDNLFVLGPSDRNYITQTDDSEKTTAITGNGEHGLRVPTGTANVKAVYRSGTGRPGNVNAQQISQMATQPLGVKSVINPLPAAGGADGDTRDQARRNVPIGITALDRLVSVPDYADFARKFAGIGKASSRRLTDGRKLLVHLTIAGKDDIPIDPTTDLYQALLQALAQAGDPNQPIQIALRRLRVLVMAAGVKIQPDYTWESVAANLRSALLDRYSFDNRELGQSAFLSEAVSTMQSIAGVQFVDMQTFDSVSESVTAAQLASLAGTLKLNSFVEAELAHVEPTEADPTKRIAPAELVILTPDIPDTLILTEITT